MHRRRRRREFSSQQRADLWSRWKAGQSLSDISRALGREPGTIHGIVAANGGFVPRERRRSQLALTLEAPVWDKVRKPAPWAAQKAAGEPLTAIRAATEAAHG